MNEAVDQHARARAEEAKDLAQQAVSKANETAKAIELHLQDFRDRNRRHELFETEVRAGLNSLQEKFSASVARIHMRIDEMIAEAADENKALRQAISDLRTAQARNTVIAGVVLAVVQGIIIYAATRGLG